MDAGHLAEFTSIFPANWDKIFDMIANSYDENIYENLPYNLAVICDIAWADYREESATWAQLDRLLFNMPLGCS